ncbi:hypothetical protein HPB50_004526 [Hyalomma asiaticum]|uniref:Uncharacterized protein n=1 Tax=Hyalomma asiaticum TaxID=266040 RepID=A0ACB7RVB8_HYAAI|nr:hypothetical protein HPB50_004526 [Hyalomma asiaticum]
MEEFWTNLYSGYCENQTEYCRTLAEFCTQNISYFNLLPDILDLEKGFGRKTDLHSVAQILACTALVKVVGDFDDVYISHATWFLYRAMLRVQKMYIFPWHLTASDTRPGMKNADAE